MSQQLISLSPDLKRLRDEGFEIEIRASLLLIHNVPYLNSSREIKYGIIVSELTLSGDKTTKPSTHVVSFVGEYPCNKDGTPIEAIRHQSKDKTLAEGLVANHSFSNKPRAGYADYHEKITIYVTIISSPAASIEENVTAKNFKVVEDLDEGSVFNYLDTNSSRADINIISDKLKNQKIGIMGLGGSGAYILDLVSKTPAKEIHLFDGDIFLQHNAFRAPGAAQIEDLKAKPPKVDYWKNIYTKTRKNIFAHHGYLNSSNISKIPELNFVFLCLDNGEAKELLVNYLEAKGISFIDVGMGIQSENNMLLGIVRVTSNTATKKDHFRKKVSFGDNAQNEYTKNIQIAELNALTAAIAVIKWKKLCGFYLDLDNEHNTNYTIDGNMLLNEDKN